MADIGTFLTFASLASLDSERKVIHNAYDAKKKKWRAIMEMTFKSARHEGRYAYIMVRVNSDYAPADGLVHRSVVIRNATFELITAEIYEVKHTMDNYGRAGTMNEIIIRDASPKQLERHLINEVWPHTN